MLKSKSGLICGVALMLLSPGWQGRADAQSKKKTDAGSAIDPRAKELLRQMSQSMRSLSAFRFQAAHETDLVLDNGQKIQVDAESRVVVERPNHVRSDRRGELADVTLYYDGDSITIHGHRTNFYATAKAPPDIDAAVDFMRAKLGMEVPGGDLLYSDLYEGLTENATSGDYIGKADVRGRSCHHLAFRGQETDWQLWVEDSPRALPCKYVITSKDIAQAPQFSVELHDWQIEKQVPDDLFTFKPPKGAERIEFVGLADASGNGQQGSQRR